MLYSRPGIKVHAKLLQDFSYGSPMEVPKLQKIVINVGIGEAGKNAKLLESVIEAALDAGRRLGRPVVVDPKADHFFDFRGSTLFKPNRKETQDAIGVTLNNEAPVAAVIVASDARAVLLDPSCGNLVEVLDPEAGLVAFEDAGERTERSILSGGAKLQWKVDWAMRWVALGVDYEMSGKDLIDSVTQSSKIARILGARPPEGFNYEMFLDENGEKISKTKGNGVTIDEWLTYAPEESLAFYIYRDPRKAKQLSFSVIPKAVDEYDQFLAAYPGQEWDKRLGNPVHHVHAGEVPAARMPISFALLLNLVAVASTDDKDLLWGFVRRYCPEASPESHPELDRLYEHRPAVPTEDRVQFGVERERLGQVLQQVPARLVVLRQLEPGTARLKLGPTATELGMGRSTLHRYLTSMANADLLQRVGDGEYVALVPAEQVERLAEVLERAPETVGRDDDFFELGGDSLRAGQLLARLEDAFGVSLPANSLFEASTVAQLAQRMAESDGSRTPPALAAPAEPPALSREAPVTFSQRRLWFLDRLEPGNPAYNLGVAVDLTGRLRPDRLRQALAEVIERHEPLRTVFAVGEDGPVQRVRPPQEAVVPLVDLSGLPVPVRQRCSDRLARQATGRPFDLERGPLARFLLVRRGGGEHEWVLALHHVISDAWSMAILVREALTLYERHAQGRPSALPPLPLQLADLARHERGRLPPEVLEAGLGYWRRRLAPPLPVLELPADRPRPAVRTTRGMLLSGRLPAELGQGIQTLGQREGATPYVVVDGGKEVSCPSLTRDVSEARLPETIQGNYFQYGLRGTAQGKRIILKEIEVPTVAATQSYA